MNIDLTVISIVVAVLAIEADKFTQFTHPTLHVLAVAGMLAVVIALTWAALFE